MALMTRLGRIAASRSASAIAAATGSAVSPARRAVASSVDGGTGDLDEEHLGNGPGARVVAQLLGQCRHRGEVAKCHGIGGYRGRYPHHVRLTPALFALFLITPLVDISLLLYVGERIGVFETIALVVGYRNARCRPRVSPGLGHSGCDPARAPIGFLSRPPRWRTAR